MVHIRIHAWGLWEMCNNYPNNSIRWSRFSSLKMMFSTYSFLQSQPLKPLTLCGLHHVVFSKTSSCNHPSRMFQNSRRYQNSQMHKSFTQHTICAANLFNLSMGLFSSFFFFIFATEFQYVTQASLWDPLGLAPWVLGSQLSAIIVVFFLL